MGSCAVKAHVGIEEKLHMSALNLKRLTASACMAIALGITGYSNASAGTNEEQTKICKKADERYKKLYGKSMADEPVQIIAMYKYTFCPPKLDIKRGSKVRFINLDKRTSHSFWFRDAGKPESDRFFGGEGTEIEIDLEPGDHRVLCGPHWEREGMIGEITVTP